LEQAAKLRVVEGQEAFEAWLENAGKALLVPFEVSEYDLLL